MSQYQSAVSEVFRNNENVEAFMSTVGGAQAATLGGPNFGQLLVKLKPRAQRKLLVNDVIAELRPKLENFPGMQVYLQNPPTVRRKRRSSTKPRRSCWQRFKRFPDFRTLPAIC